MKYFSFFVGMLFLLSACEKTGDSPQNDLFLDAASTGLVSDVSTLGGSNNDVANSVITTQDNGYIMAGTTQSNDGDIVDKTDTSFDFWVVKYDAQHNIIWNKTYGGSADERAQKIIQTQDNNYVVIGYAESSDGDVSSNNGLRDFWIVKLDTNGNLLWEKNYGFSGNDFGTNIKEASDGSLFAIGEMDVTASGGEGNINKQHAGGDYWVLKLDAAGQLIWARFFGGSFTDTPYDLVLSPNNEILVIGSSDSTDSDITNNINTYDIWGVKLDSNGNMIWQKNYGGTEVDEGRAALSINNGFILVGDTRSTDVDIVNNNGGADIWLSLVDNNGTVLSSQNFGGSNFDVPRAITQTLDNNYLITGSSRSSSGDVSINKGQNDVWVLKTNTQGTILWETSAGGSNIDFGYQSTQLNNGTIIVVGESSSNNGDIPENKGFTDALIIRIN